MSSAQQFFSAEMWLAHDGYSVQPAPVKIPGKTPLNQQQA